MKAFHKGAFAPLLLAAALAACGPAVTAQGQPHVHAAADSAAVAQARADSARHPYTEADVRFMTAMIGHHAQALEMSELAATRAASPAVRTLAARIINGQRDEIATMQQWLRDRRKPVPDPAAHPHAHHAEGAYGPMPGMLTPEQLAELRAARGEEFDRLFLTYMIQHHRGAVHMVRELFASHGAGQDEAVFRFATDANVDQATEIARMQRMLADLMFGEPVP